MSMDSTLVNNLMSREIYSVNHLSTVLACAQAINHNEAPSVLITRPKDPNKTIENPTLESGEEIVGIVTPGDILRKNVEKCLDPCVELAETIMVSPVIQINPKSSVRDALGLMLTKNIQKLVVSDDDNIVIGTITMADIAVAFLSGA